MENHYTQYPQPGQVMYSARPTMVLSAGQMCGNKRKLRAAQACDQCRTRKQKCDEGKPCSECTASGLECKYRETPPAKTDKNMEKLVSHMTAHTRGISELASKIDGFERRLRRAEHRRSSSNNFIADGQQETLMLEEQEPSIKHRSQLEDHRTGPHNLLLHWRTMRPLLRRARVEHNDGYVMEAEDRGVLRLWTRGEGIDEDDDPRPGEPASPARSDETCERGATPNDDGLWGVGFPSARRYEPQQASGLRTNGQLDLDSSTINELYDSYMRHIHIMHPILDKRRLRTMFNDFIERYSTGRPRAAFAAGMDSDQVPIRRQRFHGAGADIGTYADGNTRQQLPERSPGNAILYLVMALGKICLHKDPLPADVAESKLRTNIVVQYHTAGARSAASSPVSANINSSPMSPKSALATRSSTPSGNGVRFDSRSRQESAQRSPSVDSGLRNVDVLPGIAYYAKAAEILGDQGDGNDLSHAQMFLLAGLYKGQLARVKESMSWFTMAGRAIMILLDRYKLYNSNYWEAYGDVRLRFKTGQTQIKDMRQSLIVLASWTCLQLESDILAELRLPSSGIQSMENLLLMPHRAPEDEPYQGLQLDGRHEDYDNILLFYTAQLYLRRKLNEVHRQIYGTECLNHPLKQVQEMLKGHEDLLQRWRAKLPSELRWDDCDEPPRDILNARLRGKYYGARYIINRPFLDYVLNIMPGLKEGCSMETVARDGYGNPRDKADINLFEAIRQFDESSIWQAVRRCIDAAMQSTIAFDGLPDRLITTNIHGTAHAQFGNMLVLCASFETGDMKDIIPAGLLKHRLQRTIRFLGDLAPISPTSRADFGILQKLNNLLFPDEHSDTCHHDWLGCPWGETV